jgi:phosphatidylglycerol:prolipoprotein diacylglycerol transferase
MGVIIFSVLWKWRKKDWIDGRLFMFYLIFTAAARFSVEFIRLNPRILFGLSEAQLIAVCLFTVGVAGLIYFAKNKNLKKFIPPPIEVSQKSFRQGRDKGQK